jgi:hypothetical protein
MTDDYLMHPHFKDHYRRLMMMGGNYQRDNIKKDMTPKEQLKMQEMLGVFDRILELSMHLFEIEDMKMQMIICAQFKAYQEMIIRINSDHFRP